MLLAFQLDYVMTQTTCKNLTTALDFGRSIGTITPFHAVWTRSFPPLGVLYLEIELLIVTG